MKKFRLRTSIPAATLLLAATFSTAAIGLSSSGAAGTPQTEHRTLMVDKQAIMSGSKLGEDIRRQVLAYEDKVQADLGPQGHALEQEMQALQQMPPSSDHDKKMQALQVREAAFRQKMQARQSLVQGGELFARRHYLAELANAVEAVMKERGADLVVEKSAVVAGANGLDITEAVIQRLDSKESSFKVPLVNPPPSDAIQFLNQAK